MIFRCLAVICFIGIVGLIARGADEFEQSPIEYSASTPDNCVSRLQTAISQDRQTLQHEAKKGYLRDLLAKLHISPESQILVFSKTSVQRSVITPRTPRAIYFNDDVYVGYCHNGEQIEVSVADPHLGAVFYSLDQKVSDKPALVRETQRCLQCHGTSQTDDIPGFVVRSLYVDGSGLPILSEGGHYVNDTTPLADRWGGWYVTGKLQGQNRLGNLIIHDQGAPKPWTRENSPDLLDLDEQIAVDDYLTPRSDAVALMVFSHQIYVHNLITKADFTARQALSYQAMFNRALKEPEHKPLESVSHRIEFAGEKLVQGLLFVNAAPITQTIQGDPRYVEKFVKQGPFDKQGRSLRDFDLNRRLFKYPCSYLIYSESFDELPRVMKKFVANRLHEILTGPGDEAYSHLSADDRRAISEIIQATKPDFWAMADKKGS